MGSAKSYKFFLAFSSIYIIWGTTYFAVLIGLETIPPFILAALRYLIAGTILLLICSIKKEDIFHKLLWSNLLLGAFVLTLGQAVLFWAEKYISSGLTSVLGSTLPIWYLLADKRNWKTNFKSTLTLFSIFLGLIGIIILFLNPGDAKGVTLDPVVRNTSTARLASLVTIIACYCWAAGSLYFTYRVRTGSIYLNVGWQLIGGMVSCWLISLITHEGDRFSLSSISIRSWSALLYLAIAGSIVAFIALYWLLDRRPAPIVGTYAYVNPVIAVWIGYLLAGEKINLIQITGMTIILIAAFLANRVKFQASVVRKV